MEKVIKQTNLRTDKPAYYQKKWHINDMQEGRIKRWRSPFRRPFTL
jgi:hypothetical protein